MNTQKMTVKEAFEALKREFPKAEHVRAWNWFSSEYNDKPEQLTLEVLMDGETYRAQGEFEQGIAELKKAAPTESNRAERIRAQAKELRKQADELESKIPAL